MRAVRPDDLPVEELRTDLRHQGFTRIAKLLPVSGCTIQNVVEIMRDELSDDERLDLIKAYGKRELLAHASTVERYHRLGICTAPVDRVDIPVGWRWAKFTSMGQLMIARLGV